jgi:hypothetical protein
VFPAGSALLKSGGKSLRLSAWAEGPFTIRVQDISKPVKDYDQANPGLNRIVITTETGAGESGSVVVTAGAGDGEARDAALDAWRDKGA